MNNLLAQLEKVFRSKKRGYPGAPAAMSTPATLDSLSKRLDFIQEQVSIMIGTQGDVLDQHVAVRDLLDLDQNSANGGVGGTKDHAVLDNRSVPDQHPQDAITDLVEDQAAQDTRLTELEKHPPRTDNPHRVMHDQLEDVEDNYDHDEIDDFINRRLLCGAPCVYVQAEDPTVFCDPTKNSCDIKIGDLWVSPAVCEEPPGEPIDPMYTTQAALEETVFVDRADAKVSQLTLAETSAVQTAGLRASQVALIELTTSDEYPS